jgi:FAD/FMN-containing dehydrogenase
MRRLAAPLLALPHEAELVTALPYADLQCMIDDPPGLRNYWSAEYLTGLPDEAVEAYCALAGSMPVPTGTQHIVFPLGGAIADQPDGYPVPYRDSPWAVHPFAMWEDPADDERCRQWVRDVRARVRPWSSGAVYLNFLGDEGEDRVAAGLGEENLRRLRAVKREYDPDNVFRFNHNIKPA